MFCTRILSVTIHYKYTLQMSKNSKITKIPTKRALILMHIHCLSSSLLQDDTVLTELKPKHTGMIAL